MDEQMIERMADAIAAKLDLSPGLIADMMNDGTIYAAAIAAHSVIAGKVAEQQREAALAREALDEAMRRYPAARPALAWFGAASGLSAGEITQEVRDWANAALAPYPERR